MEDRFDDSSDRQARIRALRKVLLRMGMMRLGPPSDTGRERIETCMDLEQLERWAEQMLVVPSWDALLTDP